MLQWPDLQIGNAYHQCKIACFCSEMFWGLRCSNYVCMICVYHMTLYFKKLKACNACEARLKVLQWVIMLLWHILNGKYKLKLKWGMKLRRPHISRSRWKLPSNTSIIYGKRKRYTIIAIMETICKRGGCYYWDWRLDLQKGVCTYNWLQLNRAHTMWTS